jgi:hypothetical protein
MLGQGTLLGLFNRRTTRACTTHRPGMRGVAGQQHSRGLALGCAGHHCASTRPSLTARSTQPSGTERRGARRRDGATLPPASKSLREGRLTGATLGDGEHKDMGCPGATNRRGQLHARLDWSAARSRASVVVRGHSRACARAASPCTLGMAIWLPEVQHEAERRRTPRSLQSIPRPHGWHSQETHRTTTANSGA